MASIAEHLAFQGLCAEASSYSAEVFDRKIHLPSLEVTISLDSVGTPTANNVLSVEVVAEHNALPQPIRFTAVGFGDDVAAAGKSAAEQWFTVVFPVLHSLYADHETQNVTIGRIAARDQNGNRYGWRVLTGPVRVVFGGEGELPEPSDSVFLKALMNEITGITTRSTAQWLDAYVAVNADGKIIADCRLMNERWPAAIETLIAAGKDVLGARFGFLSFRQFMFFDPASLEDVADLRISPPRPWWRRLFGRATKR